MGRRWLALIWLGVLLLIVGCGGGDETPAVPTEATSAAESVTPEPEGTAEPTPIIEDGQFRNTARGYSVQIPDGWDAHAGLVPAPLATDAFFAPDSAEGVRPNMSVVREDLAEGRTLADYFDVKTEIIRRVAQVDMETNSREVAGQEALEVRYTREDSEPPLHKVEVVFVSEGAGWTVSLTVPPAQEAEYEALFDEFLASFRLLP